MRPLIAIVGPTAVGKTRFGIELARRLDGEILNADALQVYVGLDIGTAKPTAAERRVVRHHLIDILEPHEPFSAGEFARRARRAIDDVRGRDRTPILVGGSGFYLRALLEGLSPLPEVDPAVRRELDERLEQQGLPALYAELERLDPATAARLAPADRQRILRGLEVVLGSGRPLSQWIRERPAGQRPLPARRIGLTLPRSILYDRVGERVRSMIEQGWVEEVEELLKRGVAPEVPAFQAIGYRQIVRHVRGEWSLRAAEEDIVRATRRYAKRQMTWFRKERDIHWVCATDPVPDPASFVGDLE